MQWKLAEAKNKFSELVNRALSEGPQEVERRGDRVIIISKAEYEELSGKKPSLIEYIMDGPSFNGIELERDRSEMREVDL